ncbi:MAG: nickel-dependent lactate racemase [Fimbriimonadaceae bacterium]|nr:nickel-dependent lactate racemase [Fimbriimonadaceae bacterium]
MRLTLAYGKDGLEIEVPDANVAGVLDLRPVEAVPDPEAAVREALRRPIGTRPLRELAEGRRDAVIVVCDVTRPVPNPVILPPMLDELNAAGIPDGAITVLIATGTHRPNDEPELRRMLGEAVLARCRVVNHHCDRPEDMVALGTSPNGVPIALNRHYVNADVRLTVGMIEPHFMAGFAGGRKMVMPGVAAIETVQAWHSPAFLEHPCAHNGSVEGNPVHDEATWIANQCRPDLIVDVALTRSREIARVFAGDMEAAWNAGVAFVRTLVEAPYAPPIDICITTCGGFPLDLTYYQTVKGVVGAAPAVRPGGTVIVASACDEGIGNAHFREALHRVGDISTWLERAISGEWERVPDQWQIEELAKGVREHHVTLVTRGIPAEEFPYLHVHVAPSVEAALAEAFARHGEAARVLVVPKGPYVLPVAQRVPERDR